MTFVQFISILRARWKAALLVFVTVVALTVLLSLILPRRYTAIASVVVDVKPDPVSAIIYPGMTSPGYMATQVDIILSDRVAARVVKNLRLTENPEVRQQWMDDTTGIGSIDTWLADLLKQKLDVKPSRESSVINILYKGADPQFAAGVANAFAQAYLETSLELRVNPAKQYASFFDDRTKEARENLERAQARLSAYQRDKGIIATDERLDVENYRLNDLSGQLVAMQGLASEANSRQAQTGRNAADRTQEVLNNPLIGGLKADLSRADARLQELSSRLGENNPQVQEAKATVASIRSKIDTETARVVSSVGINGNVARQRESDVRGSLEAQRATLLRLKAVRDEGAVLTRDVESAQRAFETVVSRSDQTRLESLTTQSNSSLLNAAVPPIEPSFPRLLLNIIASIFLGLLLGIGFALVKELRDRRIRAVDDIVGALGMRVIGIMPAPQAGRSSGKAALLVKQQRMIGRLTAPKGS